MIGRIRVGRRVKPKRQKPPRKPAAAPVSAWPCGWRGEVVSSIGGCCGSPVRTTIWGCQLHGECADDLTNEPGIKVCCSCEDRMPVVLVAE